MPPRHRVRTVAAAFAATTALCLATTATAQDIDTDLYDGRWGVQLDGSPGGFRSGRLVVANFGGSFTDTTPGRAGPPKACRGRTFPITVQRSRAAELEFMVWGSAVSPECPDLSLVLKPQDDKRLEGRIADGGTVRLIRR